MFIDVNFNSGVPILVAYECGELNPLNANYLGTPCWVPSRIGLADLLI